MPTSPPTPKALARAREVVPRDGDCTCTKDGSVVCQRHRRVALGFDAYAAEQAALVERLCGALENVRGLATPIPLSTRVNAKPILTAVVEALASVPAALRARAAAERKVIEAARDLTPRSLAMVRGDECQRQMNHEFSESLSRLRVALRDLDEAQP